MEIVVKNVTNEYKKAEEKKSKIALMFNFFIGVCLILAGFLPVAKIGEYSIGNTFQLIIKFFEGLVSKDIDSSNELGFFLIFYGAFIFIGIIFFLVAFEGLKKDTDSMSYYMDEEDENLVITFKYIIKKIIVFMILTIICYSLVEMNNIVLAKYGFTSDWNLVIIAFFVVFFVKNIYCSFITLKYDEKASLFKNEILCKKTKNKKEANKGQKRRKTIMISFSLFLPIAFLTLLSLVGVGIYGCSMYYNAMYGGYNIMGFDSVAGWVVAPVDEGLLKFDQESLSGRVNRVIKTKGYGEKSIELKIDNFGNYESNTKSFRFYGDSYDYAMAKIEELEKEILSLWPEDNTKEALEEYAKQIEKMNNAIKILKENTHPYEYIDFVEGYMVDLQYNATGRNDIKWGVEEKGLKGLIFKEKITLTDNYCKQKKDMKNFAVGTNFNEELIVARVQYTDGSVRISRVKPTNIEELNNAKAGEHLLKWFDSWGEYETTITLYNE